MISKLYFQKACDRLEIVTKEKCSLRWYGLDIISAKGFEISESLKFQVFRDGEGSDVPDSLYASLISGEIMGNGACCPISQEWLAAYFADRKLKKEILAAIKNQVESISQFPMLIWDAKLENPILVTTQAEIIAATQKHYGFTPEIKSLRIIKAIRRKKQLIRS